METRRFPSRIAMQIALRYWFAASLLAFGSQAACFDMGCANTVLQDIPSPDGRRHAVVFERSCGATTGFSTQVSVVPSVRDAHGAGNVFDADTDHGKAESGPGGGPVVTLRWIDRRTVEISYDSAARVFLQETRHDDTDIRYIVTARPPRLRP